MRGVARHFEKGYVPGPLADPDAVAQSRAKAAVTLSRASDVASSFAHSSAPPRFGTGPSAISTDPPANLAGRWLLVDDSCCPFDDFWRWGDGSVGTSSRRVRRQSGPVRTP